VDSVLGERGNYAGSRKAAAEDSALTLYRVLDRTFDRTLDRAFDRAASRVRVGLVFGLRTRFWAVCLAALDPVCLAAFPCVELLLPCVVHRLCVVHWLSPVHWLFWRRSSAPAGLSFQARAHPSWSA
jgi:hypothetical protein